MYAARQKTFNKTETCFQIFRKRSKSVVPQKPVFIRPYRRPPTVLMHAKPNDAYNLTHNYYDRK